MQPFTGVNKVQVYERGGGWKIISDFLCFWEDNYKNHINGVYCQCCSSYSAHPDVPTWFLAAF